MASRAQDWLKQARSDFLHAQHALEDKDFDWACFACQQSAEKAAKAVYQHLHSIVWGHSVLALLEGLEQHRVIDASFKDVARRLDKFYIPARYPNGFQEGAPVDYYTQAEAEQAISDARLIVEFSANWIEQSDDQGIPTSLT